MKKATLFIACIFFTSIFADWMDDQIYEDTKNITHQVTSSELLEEFNKLDQQGHQVLYCRIRKNQFSYIFSTKSDKTRNDDLNAFFLTLTRKHYLPDFDFLLFMEDGYLKSSIVPILTFSANSLDKTNVCLFPDCEAVRRPDLLIEYCLRYSKRHRWEKKENKAFFRGSDTGPLHLDQYAFGNERVRLIIFSSHYPNLVDASFSLIFHNEIRNLVNFVNKPVVKFVSMKNQFLYKYLIDVDGHASSYERCRWILLSNCTLVKVCSNLTQWYYKTLIPYEHYIPINQDLSNLHDSLIWLKKYDIEARTIAMNGQILAKEIFSEKKLLLYAYKLLLALSKITLVE